MKTEWEQLPDGRWYVVEHNGMLKTGPFDTKEQAAQWFREELDMELENANASKS